MKLRLVRLNPLTLDPGGFYLMGARNIDGLKINQFPVRLEHWVGDLVSTSTGMVEVESGSWQPVEFINEFAQPDEDNNTREVRPEIQVPVYNGSSGNKRRRSDKGSGQA